MRTWSAEELFVRAYAAGAVAVQGVWDVVKGVERITKPTRRTGFDEDAAGEFLSQQQPEICRAHRLEICASCDEDNDDFWVHPRDIEDCDDIPDDTPNPTEPGLDDSELVAVRGLLQERYGRESIGCICPPGLIGRSVACRAHDAEDGEMWRAATGMFQKMTSAPVKSTPGTGVVSDPSPTIASAAPRCAVGGEGPAGSTHSPESPAGHSDDAAAEWIGGAVPVISGVLAKHRPAVDYTGVYCNTNSDDGPHDYYENWAAWRAHIAPLIANALAPQPKPAFPETGIADRLTGASEFSPQHRNSK